MKGWEKGINEGFKINVLFLFPHNFLDNTWIYNLGVKIKLEGSHHGDLILLAVSFLQLQYIWPLVENTRNLSLCSTTPMYSKSKHSLLYKLGLKQTALFRIKHNLPNAGRKDWIFP